MISDGLIHEEAWFETLITPTKVAEADYPRMLAEGLYEYWQPAIPLDAETITVRYFTPDDNLLWLDAIPIVRDGKKGDKGDDGKRGGQYWGQSKPSDPVSGDTYLDTTEMVLKEYYGTSWVSVPYTTSERYTVAINDIIASATSSQELMKIANAWVANLVAGTILANQLMAKHLTVQDGGYIQSQNYRAGASGWRIGSDGRAEFEDGVFRGEVNATSGVFENITVINGSTFRGDIISGPLECNSRNPASPSSVKIYNPNTSTEVFLNDVGGYNGSMIPANGMLGETPFDYYSMRYTIKDHYYLFIYNKDLKNLGDPVYGSAPLYENGYVKFYEKLQIGFYNPNAKTLKIRDLPTSMPDSPDTLWVDSSGYLRLRM